MDEPLMLTLLVVAAVAVVVVLAVVTTTRQQRQREQAWADVALQLGLAGRPGQDLLDRFGSLPFFRKGHSRKVRALVHGAPWGPEVWLGDYQWVTGSGKSQSTHRVTFCLVNDPRLALPHFELTPEHPLLDRVATLLGFGDVDFDDDPEFSRAYRVTGLDAGALRQAFTPEIRSQLMHRPDRLPYLSGAGSVLLFHTGRLIDPATAHDLLRHIQELHAIFAR